MSDAETDAPPEKPHRRRDTRTGEWLAEAKDDADKAEEKADSAQAELVKQLKDDRDAWRRQARFLLGILAALLLITTGAAVGLTAFNGEIPGIGKLSFRSDENAPIADENEAAEEPGP